MTVYVLFHETNSGHSEESDGYIEAIYLNEADATAARLAAIRAARDQGEAIYFDPDTEEDYPEDWEHDWTVKPYDVRPDATLPTEGFFDFLKATP